MSSNAASLTELLIRERPALLRRVQRILGGDNGAEDVIQAVWFKARRVDDSQAIDNPRAYLYRLAANLATDHGRESTRRNRLLADHYLWGPDEVISTEEQAMAQDELQRVLDAAGHLPEPTRTIFRLNRLQGLTQAEIRTPPGRVGDHGREPCTHRVATPGLGAQRPMITPAWGWPALKRLDHWTEDAV